MRKCKTAAAILAVILLLTMLIAPLTALANGSRWSGGVVITKEYAISRSTSLPSTRWRWTTA